MATQKFSNDASSMLAVSLGTSDVSVQVQSGGGAAFPSIGANEYIMLAVENALGDIEYMKATARVGDVFTVVRAQEGSTARSFTSNQARVELRLTKETMERLLQHDAGVLNRDLTIPNLTVQTTFTGAAGSFSGAVTIGGTLGVTGLLSGVTGAYSTSLTVASVSVRDGAIINTGTVLDARLSSNIPKLNSSAAFTTNLSTTGSLSSTGGLTAGGAVTGSYLWTGYNAGQTGCVSASNWFRSNGSTGWVNESHGGGIYMADATYVRTYGSKHLYCDQSIFAAGDITAYYSDERLKTRLGNIPDALAKVCALDGFYYIENEVARSLGYKSEKQQVGVSAQQVKNMLPEVVSLAPIDFEVVDGRTVSKSGEDYMTVNYERLVPLLIEAIKELEAKVRKLEAKA